MSGVKTRSQSNITQYPEGSDERAMAESETKQITSIDGLLEEFKKNQEGNARIEMKLGEIDKKVDINTKNIAEHLIKYESEQKDFNAKYQKVCDRVETNDTDIKDMKERIAQADQETLALRERVYELEKMARDLNYRDEEIRRQNIIIQGIPESPYAKTKQVVTELLSVMGVKVSHLTVGNIQRIGKRNTDAKRPRPIKVKLLSTMSKQEIFKNIGKLKDEEKWQFISIGDDLTEVKASEQKDLRCLAAFAKGKGLKASYKNGSLIIDDKKYTYKDIDSLPHDISMANAKIRDTKDGVAFQGHHAYLSNLHDSPIDDNGTKYRTNEHYYQCKRAEAAKNQLLMRKLRECKKVYELIRLAKSIEDPENWDQLRVPIMKKGIFLKYQQNPGLRDKLVQTKGFIYEATNSEFWGCGMSIAQADQIGQDVIKKPNTQGELTREYRDLFIKGELDKYLA